MKEILYIQAGNVSNHIGTHFWNTQESYFTYGDDQDDSVAESLVNHDVSFREGLSTQNESTFCPRAIVIDYKSSYGSMSRYNDLYSDDPGEREEDLWNGGISEYRQEVIPKSTYQQRLESGEDSTAEPENGDINDTDSRFWSDYNRVYYHPRSLQQVPDLPDWESNKVDWNHRKSSFKQLDTNTSLTEDSVRRFVEECDNFQGLQASFDNTSFGGFTVAFLEVLKNEYAKTPILTIPILSGLNPQSIGIEDVMHRNLILQDIACVCALNELGTQNILLQSPESWELGAWTNSLDFNKNSHYHTSAILSAHLESATLPLRLRNRRVDLSDFCTHLNWSQNTRFSHLSGALPFPTLSSLELSSSSPLPSSQEVRGTGTNGLLNQGQNQYEVFRDCIYDFSNLSRYGSKVQGSRPRNRNRYFVQRNVTRGLGLDEARRLEMYFASSTGLESPVLQSTHTEPYPLPSSFPRIFKHNPFPAPVPPSASAPPQTTTLPPTTAPSPTSITLLSTLSTSTQPSALFACYTAFARSCLSRRYNGDEAAGLEGDEVRELVEVLESLRGAYEDEDGDGDGDEGGYGYGGGGEDESVGGGDSDADADVEGVGEKELE